MPPNIPALDPAHRIFKEDKPGIRYYKILNAISDIPEGSSRQPYIAEMERILTQFCDLQKAAVKLECKGETEQAISQYKQLVAARFEKPHPYFRLCAYYTQKQLLVQVDIVCCSYLKMVQELSALGFRDSYRNELALTFIEIANELEMSPEVEAYCERLLTMQNTSSG